MREKKESVQKMKMNFVKSEPIYKSIQNTESLLAEYESTLADLEKEEQYAPLDDGDKLFKTDILDGIKDLKQKLEFRQGLEKITLETDIYELYADHANKEFYIFNNDSWFGIWFDVKEAKQLCKNLNFVSPLDQPAADVAGHYKKEYQEMDSFHKAIETFSTKTNRAWLDDDLLSSLLDHWSDQRGGWLTIDYRLVGLKKGLF